VLQGEVYNGRKTGKISTGVPVKTNPDSITIMDVMQDTTRTYLLLGKKKLEKEVKKNSFSKTITEAMQDRTYLSLDDSKFEGEVERVEGLIKQLLADHDAAQANFDASMRRRSRILGLFVSVISCLMWICFGLFERRKRNHFELFEWRKRIQDAPIGASLSAAFVIIGLIPWLLPKQRRAPGQGLTVVGLVILPCIATSLDTEDASRAPWEQVALAAGTFAFLLIISGVKRWRDGGGNVQQSKLNPDVGRNLLKDKSGEALLLNAPGDLYNDDLDHLLSWVYIKAEVAAVQAANPPLVTL
jgi:protein-S-isoprenylcysteine O-methyltransferase Ste14